MRKYIDLAVLVLLLWGAWVWVSYAEAPVPDITCCDLPDDVYDWEGNILDVHAPVVLARPQKVEVESTEPMYIEIDPNGLSFSLLDTDRLDAIEARLDRLEARLGRSRRKK